jgi:dUTP pyrophosphatase
MKIKLDEGAICPTRAHDQDAGLDLYSRGDLIIMPGESEVFDTGVHVELPAGTYGRLESKSGLNIHYDIVCLGGTIDEGYTGSIKVKLYNLGQKPYMIRKGQKIVQMVIVHCERPELEIVDRLEDTERGENGFGSTGL